jgi:hypothetical protein
VSSGPDLHYSLRARPAGSFGSSPIGRIAQNLTLTWFQFEASLLWLFVMASSLALPWPSAGAAALAFVAAPITALALWILVKLTGWVFYFIPKVGPIWGWGRLIFLWSFSRMVVEQAPKIDLPLWHSAR